MTKTFRIGVLGLTHDHVWGNLEALTALENGELVAAADPNQPLLDKVKEKHGCATYVNYKEMVEQEQLDAIYVFCDNATGADLTVWAAGRGLHVMVEKPMAATLAGAERMIEAAQNAGVRLMINWPVVWRPQVQEAIAIATRPEFGNVYQITHRTGHAGPKEECSSYFSDWLYNKELNGAGVLMDLCSYGINLAGVLLGRPERITAVTGRLGREDLSVEDNAIVVMSYPRAIATAEGSWTQVGRPTTGYLATIWGTRGSVTVGPGGGGRLWTTTAEQPESVEIEPPEPEPHMSSGTAHFLWGLATDEEFCPLCRPDACRDTQEIIEAAIVSSQTGRDISLPLQYPNDNKPRGDQ